MRLAAACAAVLVASMRPAAAAAARPAAVALAGSVTVSGSESYVRDVVLPRATTFQEETWHETWRITASRGRFAGFVLRRVGAEAEGSMFAMTRGYCLTRACVRPAWVAESGNGCLCGFTGRRLGESTLPAGRYRLHLVADGAPVTVSLRFPGLSGAVSIRRGTPYRPVIETPEPAVADPPISPQARMGANRYSAGSTRAARHGGLYYLLAWKVFAASPPKSVNQAGACLFRGAPPARSARALPVPVRRGDGRRRASERAGGDRDDVRARRAVRDVLRGARSGRAGYDEPRRVRQLAFAGERGAHADPLAGLRRLTQTATERLTMSRTAASSAAGSTGLAR